MSLAMSGYICMPWERRPDEDPQGQFVNPIHAYEGSRDRNIQSHQAKHSLNVLKQKFQPPETFSDHKLSNQTSVGTSRDNAVPSQHLTGLNFAFKYQNTA